MTRIAPSSLSPGPTRGWTGVSLMRTLMLSSMLLTLQGCVAESNIYEDRGTVCVYSEGPESSSTLQDYAAGHALRVVAAAPECFPSGCSSVIGAECQVEVVAGKVVVDTFFSIETRDGQCKSDCRAIEAVCNSAAPLEEGSYEVVLGSTAVTLEAPSKQKPICLEVP